MSIVVSTSISRMINYFEADAPRINHALKVYGFAKSIGELEGLQEEQLETLEIAAVLHDIGIKESERKYSSHAGHYQELEGPPVARELLGDLGLSSEVLNRICFLIGHHHTYTKIDGIDFQILVEADFLVNIFEEGMKKEEIRTVRGKYFKTAAAVRYLEGMYEI
ncbi:MAG: HD domain-containing protein [Bacillota bacterium]|nr:HD domain-containing protein [Bacillota bacterium]